MPARQESPGFPSLASIVAVYPKGTTFTIKSVPSPGQSERTRPERCNIAAISSSCIVASDTVTSGPHPGQSSVWSPVMRWGWIRT